MPLSTLQLSLIHRPGGGSGGVTWRERWTFDYVIDGKSLAGLLEVGERDLVGRLDRDDWQSNAESVRVLSGEAPPELPEDRVMLFVCPECGDLGCGAITAALGRKGDTFTWSDFAHENSYDELMTTHFAEVGPFTFSADAYRGVLGGTARECSAVIFKTAESAAAHVRAIRISGERFELAVDNAFTFAGRPDTIGAGLALVVDAILAQGYGPDGYEQRNGYRLYRYKPLK